MNAAVAVEEPAPDPFAPPAEDGELEAFIARTASVLARARRGMLKALARFDRLGLAQRGGFLSTAQWLSWRCGVGPGAAREQVRVARALESLPRIDAAFAAGKLSYSKVRALTRVARPETEDLLLQLAQNTSAGQLDVVVRRFAAVQGMEQGGAPFVPSFRYVALDDHRTRITLELPSGDAARLIAAVDAWRDQRAPGKAWSETGCTSRMGRAEALLQLIEAQLRGEASRAPTELVIHASAEALGVVSSATASSSASPTGSRSARAAEDAAHAGQSASGAAPGEAAGASAEAPSEGSVSSPPSQGPTDADSSRASTASVAPPLEALGVADVAGGIALSRRAFRALTCDCRVREAVHDGQGRPLGVGRARRTVPGWLMRLLRRRDPVCRFPGCSHRRFLHAHHIIHWSDGGATEVDNLVLLCSAHHSQVHDEGWHIERRSNGGFVFHRPADRRTLEPVADLPLPTRDQLEAWLQRI